MLKKNVGKRVNDISETEHQDINNFEYSRKRYNNVSVVEIICGLLALCILSMFTIMISAVILGVLGKIGMEITNYTVIISLIIVFFILVYAFNKYLSKPIS